MTFAWAGIWNKVAALMGASLAQIVAVHLVWGALVVALFGAGSACAAGSGDAAAEPAAPTQFIDPSDGWFDAGAFIDTAHGFVPLLIPITEPAVGYGLVAALVFIDRHAPGEGQRYTRPNISAVGGLATENDTRGAFAGHLGTWHEGRLRTQAALADADINLDFFGLGGSRPAGESGLGYTVAASGGMAGGSYRLGEGPLWLGLRYALVNTQTTFRGSDSELPGIDPADSDLRLAALTPSLTLDMRDNFFTPTRGWYLDLALPVFRDSFGSDRDFQLFDLEGLYFRPLQPTVFLGLRGAAKASADDTPFFLRPFVMLRGVQAMRYQGEQAAEGEAELRWQVHSRFSVLGFAGVGTARSEIGERERDESVSAGGAGFRYLVSRRHGLHMGIDVADGPDDPIWYVIFGNAWLRP